MVYEIDTGQPMEIQWNSKGNARVLQNVVNLINTYRYEIAYDRTLGINPKWIHRPSKEAAAILSNEIIALISTREPRAKIRQVKHLGTTHTGDIRLGVTVEI